MCIILYIRTHAIHKHRHREIERDIDTMAWGKGKYRANESANESMAEENERARQMHRFICWKWGLRSASKTKTFSSLFVFHSYYIRARCIQCDHDCICITQHTDWHSHTHNISQIHIDPIHCWMNGFCCGYHFFVYVYIFWFGFSFRFAHSSTSAIFHGSTV